MKIENFGQLAEVIREKRKSQNLTQTQVAGLCGVGVRFVVDLEAGKETCQIGKVIHIAKSLGVDLFAEAR
ncbi:MAG: helix-turn-helix domain-containing protein [Alphaproteobacteria bacterium]